MQITLFGVIWNVNIIYCMLAKDYRKMVLLTLISFVLQCNNVWVVAGTGVGVQAYTVAFCCIRLLFVRAKNDNKPIRMQRIGLVILFLSILVSLLCNNEIIANKLIDLLLLFVYILFVGFLLKGKVVVSEEWLEKAENRIIYLVLTVGFFQVLCKMGVLPISTILQHLFYNDISNSNAIFNYKSTWAFYSTFMEPSYCGAFLVGAFSCVVSRKQQTKRNVRIAFLLVVAILFTKSSTAYGGLAIVLAILCMARTSNLYMKIIFPIVGIGGLLFFVFGFDIVNEIIFQKSSTVSYRVRNRLNRSAIEVFINNIWLGIGYKNIRASSLVLSLLAEVGLIGFCSYSICILSYLRPLFRRENINNLKGHSMMILAIMVCQTIACPDLNFCVLWMSLSLFAIGVHCNDDPDDISKKFGVEKPYTIYF